MTIYSIIIAKEEQIDKAFSLLKKGKWLDETSMVYNPDIKGFQTTNIDAWESAKFYLKANKISIK